MDIKVLIQRQSTENTECTEEEQEPQKYLQVLKDPTKMINGFDLISVISVYSVDKKGLVLVFVSKYVLMICPFSFIIQITDF